MLWAIPNFSFFPHKRFPVKATNKQVRSPLISSNFFFVKLRRVLALQKKKQNPHAKEKSNQQRERENNQIIKQDW
jgi:hypothetical protein